MKESIEPQEVYCRACNTKNVSKVKTEFSCLQIFLIIMFCLVFPFVVFVPIFCCDNIMNYEHKCGNCKRTLYKFEHRICEKEKTSNRHQNLGCERDDNCCVCIPIKAGFYVLGIYTISNMITIIVESMRLN